MAEPAPRRGLGRSLREASKAVGCVGLGVVILLMGPFIHLHWNQCTRSDRVRLDFRQLQGALRLYAERMGRLPTEAEGLRELVTTGVLEQFPQDPWGNEYGYSLQDGSARLWSLGADGAPGGEGSDADLEHEVRLKPPPR